jgi:Flp pilus assembly CpaF family ATPase
MHPDLRAIDAISVLGAAVPIRSFQSEAISRSVGMLRTAFGPAITRFLEDAVVIEVMLNPEGRLWIDQLPGGLAETGERLSAFDGERMCDWWLIMWARKSTPKVLGYLPNCP